MDEQQFLLSEKYSGKETPEYRADLERLKKGEPLAYIIGWIPFLGCRIFLDSRPLIPRTETEYWVEKTLQEFPAEKNLKMLDLFAGSGAVGIAVLKNLPNTRVDFGELHAAHFSTIEKNLKENGIKRSQASFYETDVWSKISGRYDVIFANPPYLSKTRTSRIEKSVLLHEPHLALFVENNGMSLIEKTILGLPNHLDAGGRCYIEHEPEQTKPIALLAASIGFFCKTYCDQYQTPRFTKISRSLKSSHLAI